MSRHAIRGIATALAAISLSVNAGAAQNARRALLVGINVYRWSGAVHKNASENFENLGGAAGDAIWLKSILTSKYGFRDEDVVVLTDLTATREAILNSFRTHLLEKSSTGDVALFYFAGHGSQRSDGGGLEDTIVPADSRDPAGKVFDIGSSELHELFLALLGKTRNVTSILDTCHADTTVRGGGLTRSIRHDIREMPKGKSTDAGTARSAAAGNEIAPVIRISAARADEEASEYTDFTGGGNGVKHGLMSYELFRNLVAASGQTTWRDIMDRTRTDVARQNPLQDPQFEGPPDTLIFGGAGLSAEEAFLLITPQRQNVLLNAGSLHALSNGTELDAYPPGTREFTGQPIAKLKVTNVGDLTSEATVVSGIGPRQIPAGARAVIRSRPPTAFRFRICFEGGSPLLEAIRKAALTTIAGAELSPRDSADAVARFGEGKIHTEWPDGTMMSPPVPESDSDAGAHVARRLNAWAHWKQLLVAEGSAPVLEMKVTDSLGATSSDFADGATITIALCNKGTRPYFTRVVFFASDGSITPLDLATDGMPLAAGQCGTGGSFAITVDEGRNRSVDFLKAFATLDKVDLEPFTTGQIRGEVQDPARWSSVTKALTVVQR
jgi:hypothetical protein